MGWRTTRVAVLAVLCASVAFVPACAGGSQADASETPLDQRTEVRWFVGLGTGSQPEQVAAQEAVVDAFNASQDDIRLVLEIADNQVAFDVLQERIDAGDPPDIVGPMGLRGREMFAGDWLDLGEFATDAGVDLGAFEPQVLEQMGDGGRIDALPYAIYPSFIFYNRELFDEAGLAYPPHRVGDLYNGEVWTPQVVRDVAVALTNDKAGNTPAEPEFDHSNVVQWGFHHQFVSDPRAHGTLFGAGDLVAADGTAVIPPQWLAEWNWYYDLIWKDFAAPNRAQSSSRLLGEGNAFNAGRIGMAFSHLWYVGSIESGASANVAKWDLAVPPSVDGTTTSKIHIDSFGILSSTTERDAAVQVVGYLMGDVAAEQLIAAYGAFPASIDMRSEFVRRLSQHFPFGVDWTVIDEALRFPDVPSHEQRVPNMAHVERRFADFEKVFELDGSDIDAESETLRRDLTELFATAPSQQSPAR